MSIFIFMATLAACEVVLGDVAATVVITAPSIVIDRTGELETREQGPTAWICSVLVVDNPWIAYANIRGYLEGGNAEGKNYLNLVLSPVMELFHATQDQSRLCVYLPAEDHCYPPAPSTGAVKAVKQLTKRTYFAIRFWGQASNVRVQHYKQKLTQALTTYSKAAKLDLFFVSYFSDHVREVRYDLATAVTEPSNDLVLTKGLVVPTTTVVAVVPTLSTNKTLPVQCPVPIKPGTLPVGDYSLAQVNSERLRFFDVETVLEQNVRVASCKKLATTKGYDAFRTQDSFCFLYNFAKGFCVCEGPLSINVNRKRIVSNEGRFQNLPYPNKALDIIIIYSEIPAIQFQPQLSDQSTDYTTAKCETALLATPVKKPSLSAIFNAGRCFVSNIHDVANCNQTCRGQPGKALVRKVNPNAIVHFLSNCRKRLHVTARSELESSIYLSHPGSGCYYYPEAMSPEEVDCFITFEKAPRAQTLEVAFDYVNLDRLSTGCVDQLLVYNGRTVDKEFLVKTVCKDDPQRVSVKNAVTIVFRRYQNFQGTGRMGFRLSIFNA